LQDRVRAGAPPRDDKAPLGAFAEQWIATTLAVSDRRQSTKSLYASLTRSHLARSHLENQPMNRVTPTSVERWLTELRKRGLAESTVRTTYTVARAVGDAAVRDGLIGRNPFAAIKRPKVEQEAAHLTIEQFHALQGALAKSRYAPLVEMLGHTGLRRGEALALHWRDVDLDERLVRVRGTLARVDGDLVITAPKSKKSTRSVPLTDAAGGRAAPSQEADRRGPAQGRQQVGRHGVRVRHRVRRNPATPETLSGSYRAPLRPPACPRSDSTPSGTPQRP
jgi:integrase